MPETNVPDVTATDLTRDEMEEVAEECGIDADGLDDQQLLERLGVALGEIEASQVRSGARRRRGDGRGEGAQESSEQDLPGEPTEGRTRNELRELGLPVAGTKEELQQRLAEARGDQDDQGAPDESGAGSDGLRQKVAERVADGLASASERLRESVEDDDGDDGDDHGADGDSKLKRAGKSAWRKITPG